jgi:TonB family protein
LPKESLPRVKSSELKERMVGCAIPRLPGNVDAQGTILVEVQIDKDGNVRCARVVSGHPIMNRAGLDAVKKWRFEPLKVEGKAKPYSSLLPQ